MSATNALSDRELTRLQETGSVWLPRAVYLEAVLRAADTLGIDRTAIVIQASSDGGIEVVVAP